MKIIRNTQQKTAVIIIIEALNLSKRKLPELDKKADSAIRNKSPTNTGKKSRLRN